MYIISCLLIGQEHCHLFDFEPFKINSMNFSVPELLIYVTSVNNMADVNKKLRKCPIESQSEISLIFKIKSYNFPISFLKQ